LSDCPTDGTQKVGDCYLYDLTASTQTKILPGSTTSIDFLGKEYSIVCNKGAVDFLKFLYPDGNDGYTDQFGGPPYAMNAHADDYIICAPYISGSGKCQGEGSAKCERKTVQVASYENTPNGGSSCDEVVFYLEPMACPTTGGGTKDCSGSKSGGKKGDDSSDDSKDGSYSKGGYKSGGSKEHDSSKSGGKGGIFNGWGGKEGDSKAKDGSKFDLPGKIGDKKAYTGGAKDDGSKNTKSGDDKPCAKGKSG
jgi:hypothetical protein